MTRREGISFFLFFFPSFSRIGWREKVRENVALTLVGSHSVSRMLSRLYASSLCVATRCVIIAVVVHREPRVSVPCIHVYVCVCVCGGMCVRTSVCAMSDVRWTLLTHYAVYLHSGGYDGLGDFNTNASRFLSRRAWYTAWTRDVPQRRGY